MQLYTSQETKKIESLAISLGKDNAYSLMEKAAEFSLNILVEEWEDVDQIIVFCARGNNSGDGFLLASLAKDLGIESYIVKTTPLEKLSAASRRSLETAKKNKVKLLTNKTLEKIKISKRAVIVDALIGTGLKGPVRKDSEKCISKINKLGLKNPILSLDIPSGICSDTGRRMGLCVQADITASFVALKRGCFTSEGRSASGELIFSDLGIKKSLINKVQSISSIIDMEPTLDKLINRESNSHKGNFGHVLVIGGNHGFGGAGILTAKAAVYSGSGLVSLATRPEHVAACIAQCPEIMAKGIDTGQDAEVFLKNPDVIVIGPGLGRTAWSEQLMQRVFWEANKRDLPVIMDADALNLLPVLRLSSKKPPLLILTPHPGEAARLLGITIEEVESDRFKSVLAIEEKYNATVVLKGSGTLVASRKNNKQSIGVCDAGNPGMATGGMGDILAGVIGSFIAQGIPMVESVNSAVDLHSKAADLCSIEIGEISLQPSDVIDEIRYLLKS